MDERIPQGGFPARVDDRGRLKLPTDFRRVIELHPEWFLTQGKDEKSLDLKTTGDNTQMVAVDPIGRMLIPPYLSAGFKSKSVHVFWQRDHFVVMTMEEFEKMIHAGEVT